MLNTLQLYHSGSGRFLDEEGKEEHRVRGISGWNELPQSEIETGIIELKQSIMASIENGWIKEDKPTLDV